jgi:isochorismate pyruvate lyase
MMDAPANLDDVRAQIDALDAEIVRLLAERGRYVTQAARFKCTADEVAAPARAAQVIGRVRALASAHDADPDIVEAIYRTIIARFTSAELKEFSQP